MKQGTLKFATIVASKNQCAEIVKKVAINVVHTNREEDFLKNIADGINKELNSLNVIAFASVNGSQKAKDIQITDADGSVILDVEVKRERTGRPQLNGTPLDPTVLYVLYKTESPRSCIVATGLELGGSQGSFDNNNQAVAELRKYFRDGSNIDQCTQAVVYARYTRESSKKTGLSESFYPRMMFNVDNIFTKPKKLVVASKATDVWARSMGADVLVDYIKSYMGSSITVAMNADKIDKVSTASANKSRKNTISENAVIQILSMLMANGKIRSFASQPRGTQEFGDFDVVLSNGKKITIEVKQGELGVTTTNSNTIKSDQDVLYVMIKANTKKNRPAEVAVLAGCAIRTEELTNLDYEFKSVYQGMFDINVPKNEKQIQVDLLRLSEISGKIAGIETKTGLIWVSQYARGKWDINYNPFKSAKFDITKLD